MIPFMKIEENILLKDLTTFRIGGTARYFCEAESIDDIKEAISFSEKNKLPIYILGGGSNVLISDDGFFGLVIKISLRGISIEEKNGRIIAKASAGESWDDFVNYLIKNNFFGLELLSGIPGTVGASPVQNIGAYGKEVSQFIEWVDVFDIKTKENKKFFNNECVFGYRDSIFKKDFGKNLIITEVAFNLSKNYQTQINHKEISEELLKRGITIEEAKAKDVRDAVLLVRALKLPDLNVYGTAGSFFKNPVVDKKQADYLIEKYPDMPVFSTDNNDLKKLSAGWLIEHAGNKKGLRHGGVGIYEKHALVLVNYSGGSSDEIFSLASLIQEKVFEIFGVRLQFEVCFVGNFFKK